MSTPVPASESYGHYEIERELGRGAMGTVYLARDRRIGRRVALKTINLSQQQFEDSSSAKAYFERFQREAEVCGSLSHPNVVTLYEPGYHDDRIAFLAIEYVEGETLQAAMKRYRPDPMPIEFATRVAMDVMQGLAYAHSRGIIHRDIKPANILIGIDGISKIADFGIARPQNSSMTATGAMMGTPNYMPPEQVLGRALIPRADIFSAGVMLFEMLTATKPFAANDVTAVLHNILRQTPPPVGDLNPKAGPELTDLVREMIAKDPLDRPSASDALERLEKIARGPTADSASRLVGPEVVSPSTIPVWQRPVSRLVAASVIAGAILATALPGVMIYARIDSEPTVTIAPEQLQEYEAKRRTMNEAHALLAAGRYTESMTRYDAYLQKYPYSTAALEGKQLAQDLLDLQQPAKSKRTSQRRRSSPSEDISPSELLNRVRRFFRN